MKFNNLLRLLMIHDPLNEISKNESRAIAKKPRDAAAVRFGLKFADIHYKFKGSQAPTARFQSSRHTGAKQNLT